MTVDQALAAAARQLKEDPKEYIDILMKRTLKKLERLLDITREQKKMAFDLQKKESFELLHVKEDLIMDVIMIKAEDETYVKPVKKQKQKKRAEEFQSKGEEIKNSVSEDQSQDNETDNNDKDRPEQLVLDF